MFSVPGWSVSTSTLVQEKPRSKKAQSPKEGVSRNEISKKRKRDDEPQSNSKDFLTSKDVDHNKTISNRSKELETGSVAQSARRDGISQKSGGRHAVATGDLKRSKKSKNFKEDRTEIGRETVRTEPGQKYGEDGTVQKQAIRVRSIPPESVSSANLTPLQMKMRNKLTSARFRHLNELLYNSSSGDAMTLFSTSPNMFAEYHAGFSQQVKDSWPQNPVEGYVRAIKFRGQLSEKNGSAIPLPRRKTGSCTITDLGCGDAPLARGCQASVKSLRLKFHNYDLHAASSFITKADISNLPLRDGEVDIAVFCLSLMGTNWISFVEEAWRVVRGDGKGEIWVAEVKSRFGRVIKGRVVTNSVGLRRKVQTPRKGDRDEDEFAKLEKYAEDETTADRPDDSTDVSAFVKVFTRRGFQLREGSVDKSNKMFVSMIFTKSGIPTAGKYKGLKWNGKEYVKQTETPPSRHMVGQRDEEEISVEKEAEALKPCVYKLR